MTLKEYVCELEEQVPELAWKFEGWSEESKLYMYLHHIQLKHMAEFKKLLLEMKNV